MNRASEIERREERGFGGSARKYAGKRPGAAAPRPSALVSLVPGDCDKTHLELATWIDGKTRQRQFNARADVIPHDNSSDGSSSAVMNPLADMSYPSTCVP